MRPRDHGHDNGGQQREGDTPPAEDCHEGRRIVSVALANIGDDSGHQHERQHRGNENSHQEIPNARNREGTHLVEVGTQSLHSRPHVGAVEGQRNGAAHDANVVNERIHDVQGVQAGTRSEEHQGNQHCGHAHDEGRGHRLEGELVLDCAADHLQEGQKRSQARQNQRGEEEDTEEGAAGHHRDDLGEGHERQDRAGQSLQFTHGHALAVGHEAEGRKHADTGKNFEGGVRETCDQRRSRQIGLALEVGSVGHHDAESHGQGEEDLREGREPHLRVGQSHPVRGKEGVESFQCAGQEQGAHDERQEEDDQEGQEDAVCCFHSPVDAQAYDQQDEHPHQSQGDGDGHDRRPAEGVTGCYLQEGFEEESLGVAPPGFRHGVDDVLCGPCHDSCVVDEDDEADGDAEPAEELTLGVHAAQRPRRGATEFVPDSVFEPQDRDAGEQQGNEVRNEEGAAAVGVGHPGESPNISQSDC